jgi:dephospho-CoA kinase
MFVLQTRPKNGKNEKNEKNVPSRMDAPMRIYGLTGGAGSGKSEAARCFQELGIPVIDADKVGHELLEPSSPAFDELVAALGPQILTEGKLDREKIARIVFADPARLKLLNSIVHPRIMQIIAERCAAFAQQGHSAAIVDAALIAENGRKDPWLSGVILVLCKTETRLQRLTALRGMPDEQARQRIEAQTPPESKRPLADWIIRNDGSLDELREKVRAVANAINKG